MATAFKKGQVVKVKTVVPEGPVEALRMDENGEFFYLVKWIDVDGAQHERWFAEADLAAGA
jgi:uncharacterized protein YodC (DUF2158 family)